MEKVWVFFLQACLLFLAEIHSLNCDGQVLDYIKAIPFPRGTAVSKKLHEV